MPRRAIFAALVVALQLTLLGATAVSTAPQARAATTPNLRIVLSAMTSAVTNPNDVVQAHGRVYNTGDVTLSSVNAYLWYTDEPLADRREIGAASQEKPGDREGNRLDEPWTYVHTIVDSLAPGTNTAFHLNVPVQQLHLDKAGVYSVGVDISGYAQDTGEKQVWSTRTFLPYVPTSAQAKPVEIAFTLPLTGTPGQVGGNQLLDDSAARRLAPNGRLRKLLEFGASNNLSFLVDPELLTEAELISRTYRELDGTDPEPAGQANAQAFLAEAKKTFASNDTMLLPYADPDLSALLRAGLTPQLTEAFGAATRIQKRYEASGPIAWPGTGYVNKKQLDAISAAGGKRLVLAQSSLPELPADGTAPVVSLETPDGPVTALVTDQSLLAGGPKGEEPGLLRRQRLLAETAMLALDSGGAGTPADAAPRRLVAALPRDFAPDRFADDLFEVVQTTPWLQQVSAGSLLNSPPVAYGDTDTLAYPKTAQRAELDSSVVDDLRKYSTDSFTFLDLLVAPEEQRAGLYQAFLRGASTAWRRDPEGASDLIRAMDAQLDNQLDDVVVVPPRLVTLSSRTGRFPVTISNTSNTSVLVGLDVRPSVSGLVDVAPIEPVRIDPGRKATVTVNAEATRGGIASLTVGLRTKQGITFGESATLTLRVTDYGRVGWLVIGFGVGLLMIAAAVKIVRRIRGATKRREAEPTPERPREHSHL